MNAGDRLKESNNINSSLHVLGRCLTAIRFVSFRYLNESSIFNVLFSNFLLFVFFRDNQRKNEKKPIPFRDSKLTRFFQRALTGHERITMIVNANMSPVLYDETVNVLKFSAIAKQIIFEAPIKKAKAPVKKSHFSIMFYKPNPHGTMCWDLPPEGLFSSFFIVFQN